mgnify:CR=1 FL=1
MHDAQEQQIRELQSGLQETNAVRERFSGEISRLKERKISVQNDYDGVIRQLLEQYGLFSGTPKDRYSDGRLDEILMEALSQERVLYLSFPVTVPAGGSVTVAASFWKAPSYDYGCSGSENVGLQGYDLVTALGSTLEFTGQTAALVNTDTIEIVRQNLGFDLENGVTQVSLDLAEPHYYLEIRPLEG